MQEQHVEILTPDHPLWQSLTAHLHTCKQAREVLEEDDAPKDQDSIFLAVVVDGKVVASLTLVKQPVTIPLTEWAGQRDRQLRDEDGTPQYETFVQTFFVDEPHRRKGYGLALQQEALVQTTHLGCVQMRSWSSLDKTANYQLKLKLGFAFHPEVQQTASGLKVSGGYFVKRVD